MNEYFTSRPIAITDVETTGLDPKIHEIIEIGLLVIDQQSLQVLDSLDIKIKPQHIETASQSALSLNGYNEAGWKDAKALEEAMRLYGEKTKGAIFCAHNVTFDWSFIKEAFSKTAIENKLDYHRLDLFTMGWTALVGTGIKLLRLNNLAAYLGVPEEPTPHRGINGARTAYEVLKKLVNMNKSFERAKVCYEQNCEHVRSLNQIMWQVPIIAMTLTGGLWYGVATLTSIASGMKVTLLFFSAVANIFMIFILQRVRSVMAAYLDKIKEFNLAGFADTQSARATGWLKERGVVNTFCVLLFIAALMSLASIYLFENPKTTSQRSNKNAPSSHSATH